MDPLRTFSSSRFAHTRTNLPTLTHPHSLSGSDPSCRRRGENTLCNRRLEPRGLDDSLLMADVAVAVRASETAMKMDSDGGGSKRKVKAKGRRQRKEDEDFVPEEDLLSKKRKGEEVPRSRPKRAAAGANFKEVDAEIEAEYVTPKEEKMAMQEPEALALTSCEKDEPRLLIDFAFHDADGEPQPVEVVGSQEVYVTCVVLPNRKPIDKRKGVLVPFMGPVLEWGFENYDKGEPAVWVGTGLAYYTLVQPSGNYKKHFTLLLEKALVCVEIYRALSGDPALGLNELFGRVSRVVRSGRQSFFTRDYLIDHGSFIAGQLKALDANADDDEQLFSGLPALEALESECSKRVAAPIWAAGDVKKPGTLTIRDVSGSNNSVPEDTDLEINADEKLARHFQEMENRKLASRQNRNQGAAGKRAKVYIKINEAEIASDYPLPAYYRAEEEETDEYIFFDDDNAFLAPHELPHRVLHDWTLYNSDSRLVSLELLPMLSGVEMDSEVFGSGLMAEDDGNAFTCEEEEEVVEVEASSLALVTTTSSSNGNGTSENGNGSGSPHGIRIYLSAIKEWMIEFGAGMVFMSIRTDGAWYRLGKPSGQYKPWYSPVLRTARLAIKVITMLKQQQRIARLSFSDIVKRLIEHLKEDPKFCFMKVADVERYLVVHGQIILQQFAEYPEEQIRRSAFVTGLMTKMEEKHHVKLLVGKKTLIKKGRNLNPRANLQPDAKKKKPMRATTTALVNRVWSTYYARYNLNADLSTTEVKEDDLAVAKAEGGAEGDEEDDDEEEEEEEDDPTPLAPKPYEKKTQQIRLTQEAKKSKAEVSEIAVGDAVAVNLDDYIHDSEQLPSMLLVEYLYELKGGTRMLHGRGLIAAAETVLGNAGDEREVFLISNCADVEVSGVQKVVVVMKRRPEGYADRKVNALKDEADRARAKERETQGLPKEFFCRAVYSPDKGAFLSLPMEGLAVGDVGSCKACVLRNEEEKLKANKLLDDGGFRLEGVEYKRGDYLYLDPTVFQSLENKDEPGAGVVFKGGRNKGLRPFAICQLLSVQKTAKNILSTKMNVQRFYRPDDFGTHRGYTADIHEVYYSEDTATVEINHVRGRCEVLRPGPVLESAVKAGAANLFFCSRFCDPKTGTVKQLPATVKLSTYSRHADSNAVAELKAKAKGKGKAVEDENCPPSPVTSHENCLSTLDIFAGCGGLSEGLHQAGVSKTKWAIEYEQPAAEAFKLNHPESDVFCENCNVILRCIMEQGGDADDCQSTPEAEQMATALGDEKKKLLPRQGEVDFINGGPPCQGFSGMNRFNTGLWSKVQCEMILGFLSYAEYFRPRYFLLENVRNFVSFNKGQTFRLTLATLLEMGYQVRFGVLQAGNYGVSQSRKRAFIWAAAPNEILPEWPEPMHVFGSCQLKITLPGGVSYAAVRDAGKGAPLRAMTVKDTIYDLPPVENGASKEDIKYSDPPVSWFQKQIRGDETVLYDHISKEMNETNFERCKRIPKYPGADWRSLPDIKIKLSTGSLVDLIPWCLPNTAARHNQWKGLYGRLDWDGNFPTSVTDPQPMGKVGMCFHPEQDRIVTVRECARSQGFPDSYKFSGNIQSKHRQIGNAVPPPLARALGVMLKEAIHSRAG